MLKPFLFRANSYLRYYLVAADEHSLHTPYVYELYTKVLKPWHPIIEPLWDQLYEKALHNQDMIEVTDYGAGSQIHPNPQRRVSSIARVSSSPLRFAKVLHHLAMHLQASHIVELGTSLGFTSLHLRGSVPGRKLSTFEGSPSIAALARQHFTEAGIDDINLIEGPIHYSLPYYLQDCPPIDLVYLDAHHTAEATLRYFEWLEPHLHSDSVVVVDDIYWSSDMFEGWKRLMNHDRVRVSIDLFEAGILLLKPGLQQQHLTLSY